MSNPWQKPQPIPAPDGLIGVRDMLIAMEATRWPIYKFLMAPDLLVELQAQALDQRCFLGKAVLCPDADQVDLHRPWSAPQYRIGFELRHRDDAWIWHPRRWMGERRTAYVTHQDNHARVLALFTESRFALLKPSMFLRPHCLVCGKFLADPISRARLVGPECSQAWGAMRKPTFLPFWEGATGTPAA
jgi:hypothetical protein